MNWRNDMKIKSIIRTCAIALAIGGMAEDGFGTESSVLPGWDSDFVAVTNRAIAAHKPIVMIWANTGCEFCEDLEADVRKSDFVKWREASEYEFCFVLGVGGKDPQGAEGAKQFARTAGGTQSAGNYYPFECLYWAKSDGTVVASRFSRTTGAQLMKFADSLFADYSPMPDYTGGDLEFTGSYAHARLEAEAGFTKYVDVALVRDTAAAPFSATNTLTAKLGSAEIRRETILWKENENRRTIRVEMPDSAKAGDEIALSLSAADGATRTGAKIFVVDEQENSTKNPLFIGERSAATLAYGEWTMDLDVAMEKFKSDPNAHLMAIASGSLWCPDCVMTDAHVLENPAFKAWAVENKVILVDIDVPNFPNTTNSACLLTKVIGRTSDSYISGRGTLATNELERFQSGAGYLSRHMVSDATAAMILERNRSLIGENTLNGGWNNPARTNQNRTGIPNFFALRRDGTLAGTFETFDAIGPSEFKDAYLKRLSELIALCNSSGDEISNRSWQTTKYEFAGEKSSLEGTLSAINLNDTYRLALIDSPATEQSVTVIGNDTNSVVTVSIIKVTEGTAKTLTAATGKLADGISVSAIISSTADKYYIVVTGEASGTLSADSTAPSTKVSYTLSGARRTIENPFQNAWTAKKITTTLPLFGTDGLTLKGVLALSLKKSGKITAKYSTGNKSLALFSGRWDATIAADGTATASLARKGFKLSLVMSTDGVIATEIDDGNTTVASCSCGLAEGYSDFCGTYSIATQSIAMAPTLNPAGNAVMTLKMATSKTATSKGTFKYTIYLPNGRKLYSSTNITWLDENYGIVPILKTSGSDSFAATLKVRRNAGLAPSARAIRILDGTTAIWTSSSAGSVFTRKFNIYGSWYDKESSLLTETEDESLTLSFSPDTSLVANSPKYGALLAVSGNEAKISVTDNNITAEKAANFTFKFNRNTGIITGTTHLSFEGKSKVAAKYTGIIVRGWFSDCECSEDDDQLIEMESIAFASGFCLFTDKIQRKSVKRSFPISLK